MLHASELVVYDGRDEVARHERLIAKGGTRLELDHYLEALVRTPGALPGATALDQARSGGRFTPVHDAWWEAAVKAHGERDGTRALIEVLLLGRHLPHEHLVTGLAAALRTGALTADAVLLGTLVLSTVKVVPGEHLSVSLTTGTSSPGESPLRRHLGQRRRICSHRPHNGVQSQGLPEHVTPRRLQPSRGSPVVARHTLSLRRHGTQDHDLQLEY
ncbi:hypothetical protein ABZ580_32355 [Streptomyces sp. NPDC012486]|uniref:hypothetical protein n=1 Tax=Streptomyces sp. NPDC012486 TaxID=3156669 RepID=UPI00340AEE72